MTPFEYTTVLIFLLFIGTVAYLVIPDIIKMIKIIIEDNPHEAI